MNIEFHYYILSYLAGHAGFSTADAHTLAYASQFVDYNLVTYRVDTPRGNYETIPTQNFGFWNVNTPRDVYIPLHFFPGDPDYPGAARSDGRTNRLNTTPDSPGVKRLLVGALKSRDLYRIGIALHTYADSWAHQNFSGVREEWNLCDPDSLIPPIGHAQVLGSPDKLSIVWRDPRLPPETAKISNRERDFAAARKIYKYLCTYNRRPFHDADVVLDFLSGVIGAPGRERPMEERILDLMVTFDIPRFDRAEWIGAAVAANEIPDDDAALTGWDKFMWLKDELLHRTRLVPKRPVPARDGFFDSHFYRFIEAAKAQVADAHSIIANELKIAV